MRSFATGRSGLKNIRWAAAFAALVFTSGTLAAGGCGGSGKSQNDNADGEIPRCGNGILEPGELCDEGDNNSDTEPDTCRTNCASPRCGDGVADSGEACDSLDLRLLFCEDHGFTGGSLYCNFDCTLDFSRCSTCGNTLLEEDEECDGTNLGYQDCTSVLGLQDGHLFCNPDCTFDVSDCHTCGNGIVEGPEDCEGTLTGLTCVDAGHTGGGDVHCTETCFHDDSECFDCGDTVCERELGETWHHCPQECGWSDITAGFFHTCALRRDATVWCWGCNSTGELGNGTTLESGDPVRVLNLSGVVSVAAAGAHACALRGDGTIWCWGDNFYGQLGNGTNLPYNTPQHVQNLTNMVGVAAKYYFTCGLKDDGTAWCWGSNFEGQLGDGTQQQRNLPVQVVGLTDAAAISAGSAHACALKTNGTVWCWGQNLYGQLGDGTTQTRLTPVQVSGLVDAAMIAIGSSHTCAVKTDGTMWCWGNNSDGQIGDGTTQIRVRPEQVQGLSGVVDLELGQSRTFAVKSDGTAWCWGNNSGGALGDGTTEHRHLPVPVNGLDNVAAISSRTMQSCAVRGDGTAWCWGQNQECPRLGVPDTPFPLPLCEGPNCGVCGNAIREPLAGETCDGTDLGGMACDDFCFTGGTLGCSSTCQPDTTGCTGGPMCGNNLAECGEPCDGTDLRGATCQDLGYTGGQPACDQNCALVTSACTGFVGYLFEDFEGGSVSNWTLSGDWAVGTPWQGNEPGGTHSGQNCAGTVIGGNYSTNQSYGGCAMVTPPVTLSAATAPVMQFYQYIDCSATYHGGNIWISTDGGVNWTFMDDSVVEPDYHCSNVGGWNAFSGDYSAMGWHPVVVDLSSYVGQVVHLRFSFFSDHQAVSLPGWYVDDVLVTENDHVPVLHQTDQNLGIVTVGLSFQRQLIATGGAGSYQWSIQGGSNISWLSLDPATGTLTGTSGTTDVGPGQVTVRVAAATNQNNFDDRTFFFYVAQPASLPVAFDFEGTHPQDWTFRGQWQWGNPSGTGPVACHGGSGCVGVVMDGEYSPGNEYDTCVLDSPPIDLAGTVAPTMTFYHYVHTEPNYDGGNLRVSIDGGDTWDVLDNTLVDPDYDSPSVGGTWAYSGDKSFLGWQPVSVDLSAYVGQVIRIRFAFYSDSVQNAPGWYIDDVLVTSN